jgi:hypothetical protein
LAGGIATLVWPNKNDWDPLHSIVGPVIVYVAAAALIVGGAGMLFGRTAKAGAATAGVVYLVLALLCVLQIVAAPLAYYGYGDFFLQFSLVTGAVLVYASLSGWTPDRLDRVGRILWGLCAASFALYQAFYLSYTAGLVPKWFPPSQMFWTLLTTVAFALAAIGLLTNRLALLATRLLTLMLALLGLIVWVPAVLAVPNQSNWNELIENFAITGAAWILADLLRKDPAIAPAEAAL